MTSLQLLRKVSEESKEEKKRLTNSYFGGDRLYFKKQLSKFIHCYVDNDIYETINNVSSAYARSLDY